MTDIGADIVAVDVGLAFGRGTGAVLGVASTFTTGTDAALGTEVALAAGAGAVTLAGALFAGALISDFLAPPSTVG